MSVSSGAIAYFDILGYQNLLLNNEPEEVADKVISRITSLNASVTEEIVKQFPKLSESKKLDPVFASYKWLIFSDTILLTNEFPPEESPKDKVLRWFITLKLCAHIQGYMFKNGMPLRGAITYGRYMVKDLCFAGRPIIDAYQLANRLELSVVVVTEDMEKEMAIVAACEIKTMTGAAVTNAYLERYLVPLKEKQSQHFRTVDYFDEAELNDKDLRQETLIRFWGHKKDVPLSVIDKVTNTEQHLRYLKSKREPVK